MPPGSLTARTSPPHVNHIPGTWSQVTVAGHLCDVYEPPRRNEHGYAVIYLHGVHLTRLVDKTAFCGEFARYGLPVIAPMTGRSWWTDKICPDFDLQLTAQRYLLDHIVPFAAERFDSRPPRMALLGTSMGGQGALRFAFKFPNVFPIVAAISPAIDYQLRFDEEGEETLPAMYPDAEAVRQDTATLHVHPLNWPRNLWFCSDPEDHRWHDSAQKLRMKLWALGIPHECELEASAGGHGWDYYNQMAPTALAFIAARLESERLRVS